MSASFVAPALALSLLLLWKLGRLGRWLQARPLRRALSRLGDRMFLEPLLWQERSAERPLPERMLLIGRRDGRRSELSFVQVPGGSQDLIAQVVLRIRRPLGELRVGLTREVVVCRPELAHLELPESWSTSGDEGALVRLLEQPDARRQLERLLVRATDEVLLGERGLMFRTHVSVQDLELNRVELAWNALYALALLCERREIRVDVEDKQTTWLSKLGKARCPYCWETVELGARLQACFHCQTVHHAECMQEAGGCTVFGCRGSARFRRDRLGRLETLNRR